MKSNLLPTFPTLPTENDFYKDTAFRNTCTNIIV